MSTSPSDTTPSTKLTSTWAVLGLVLGFLFWPLGALFSILGLRETGPSGPRAGRGLAIAGLIVSVLGAIGTVLVILFLTLAAGSAVDAVSEASDQGIEADAPAAGSEPATDVVIDSCAKDEDPGMDGFVEASLTVTNSTNQSRSYIISVSGNDESGQRVAELNAVANDVAPGQSATIEAFGSLADGKTLSGCALAGVDRF